MTLLHTANSTTVQILPQIPNFNVQKEYFYEHIVILDAIWFSSYIELLGKAVYTWGSSTV